MYLAVPSVEHVTSGLAGSSTISSRAPGSLQSRAANCAVMSLVIQARSVGSVGAPAAPDAEGDGAGDGLAEADAVGDGVGAISASGTALLLVGEALLTVVGVG